MKVLLIDQVPEVNNKYTFSLAEALQAAGIDITVYGVEGDTSSWNVPHVNYFYNYSTKGNMISKVISYKKSWDRIIKYCLQNKIELVHVQWYTFSPFDYLYHNKLRKFGIKVVTTIHDLLPFNTRFYDLFFHKRIYAKANMVISQARMNQSRLVQEFGVGEDKIVYIPHGHFMDYAEAATKEESRAALELPANKKIILFFGQIKKVKGLDVLIKALKKVTDRHEDILCVIAGKVWQDDFSTYQKLIDENNLENYIRTDVKFIADSDIKYYFNAADIVALPYRQIYQSGVVLLAYAYEKPIVATTEGEFITVVKDKETGLLVESGNDDALAEAINWYLEHPEQADAFGKAGREDLIVRLSWKTIAEDVKKIYQNLLA